MKPKGPLMIEHRLIERMLNEIEKEIKKINDRKIVDPVFIDIAVDFIRTYADRTHHGKEEDILFRALEKKVLSPEDEKVMIELIEEHKFARKIVGELVESKNIYMGGKKSAIDDITEKLNILIKFYPEHILKEDNVFFPNTEKYLNEMEQDKLLFDFWEFDRKMIHEKYTKVVNEIAAR
jgi:hemerythrin-like domain-containing protein